MTAPTPPSFIELYDAIQAIATKHPDKVTLGDLHYSQRTATGSQPKQKFASFGITLGNEHYGTDVNVRDDGNSLVRVNLIEWGKPPMKDILGMAISTQAILSLIQKIGPNLDPDNPPKGQNIIQKLGPIIRSQIHTGSPQKKGLQDGNLCA